MANFRTSYPAIVVVLSLAGLLAEDVSSSGSLLMKLAKLENLIPGAITLEGLADKLSPEISAIGALSTEEKVAAFEEAAEILVTDLKFSAPQAIAARDACFLLAEWIVAGVPAIKAVVKLKRA